MSLDLYQLTTLLGFPEELLEAPHTMSFFFRKLPPHRNYVVSCGVRHILQHCQNLGLSPEERELIDAHPMLGPALQTDMGLRVRDALFCTEGFEGEIDAIPEGTFAFAGPAWREDGSPFLLEGRQFTAYTPLLQVRTDLIRCKLIETPWLSRLNYLSMIASKASRVVAAATQDGVDRPVIEFGQRRTHPEAAVDAAYAAYLAGCSSTSNLAASLRYGIPLVGTMDHFAIMASERPDLPVSETELEFFRTFCERFPHNATLLVDTYDTERGIRNAVLAGATMVRIDSNVTPETVRHARGLLDSLGAPHVKLFLSDGLDEYRIRDLIGAGADGFGVGENLTCSPDAATGIGAVGKLVENATGPTMKRTSGKTTLPGRLQVYRFPDHDLLTLWGEPKPRGGTPLLRPVWRGRQCVDFHTYGVAEDARRLIRSRHAALPGSFRSLDPSPPWRFVLSNRLAMLIEQLNARS